MSNLPIYIICPQSRVTGGTELLHQLADALVRNKVDARVVYYPFAEAAPVPAAFTQYQIHTSLYSDIPKGATVIVPEIYTFLFHKFKNNRVLMWWLSVDNYHLSSKIGYTLRNGQMPWQFMNVGKGLPDYVVGHLAQSEYARQFVSEHLPSQPCARLSDYINKDYIGRMSDVGTENRRNIVAYNPAKGKEQTAQILALMDRDVAVPIVNMSRDQVAELLGTAKVYLDFGNHPGKDRIPREAAAMGCVVITNKRGSAANSVDVPIPESLKIDDNDPTFASQAVKVIDSVLNDFRSYHLLLSDYRAMIAREPDQFESDVREIFVDNVAQLLPAR